MNHGNSYRPIELGHFSLISWFTVKSRGKRGSCGSRLVEPKEKGKRAIVGENPAGPFVYEHCLAYSTPPSWLTPTRAGRNYAAIGGKLRGWHSFSSELG